MLLLRWDIESIQKKATEFRIWATKILKEYIAKGFALNENNNNE